ncbi:hypothetical protein GCM10025869_12350 [Homoserinibacter gongjuensis]|uniref:Uncharacterized protein n=1 Tax=Homoserinibacter gongjuensis TaxID=1162968 RepID=A0ABQ6JT82_9MICO|nr:hypothetical protein GCM10025869_12350 [Homoserinibacter gongjuensis]
MFTQHHLLDDRVRLLAYRIRQPQQQRDDEPVGHERGTACSEERRREARERDDARDAADDDEHLQPDGEREADCEQATEVILTGDADAEATRHEDQVEAQDREEADEAELLAEARDDVVALRERHQVGATLPETRADEAAVGEAEDALHELVASAVALVDLGVEGVEPVLEAPGDVRKHAGGDPAARGEEGESDQDPAAAAGGHVEHHEEEAEVEQRGSEVALDHDDAHREDPDHQDRAEVTRSRQTQSEEGAAHERERVARGDEVAGEEDREQDLRELTRLEREDADLHPDIRVGTRLADHRNDRQQQQHDADEHREVAVTLQHAVVAHEQQSADREDERDGRPGDLPHAVRRPARVALGDVEPVDHGDAEPREKRRDRHHERIALGRHDTLHEVQHEHEHAGSGGQREHAGVQLPGGAELDERERGGRDAERDHEQQ